MRAPMRNVTSVSHVSDYEYLSCGHRLVSPRTVKQILARRVPKRRRCHKCAKGMPPDSRPAREGE